MLDDAEPDPYFIGEHLVAASSKLITIDKILKDILPKGERVLIFSVKSHNQITASLADAIFL